MTQAEVQVAVSTLNLLSIDPLPMQHAKCVVLPVRE